MHSFWFHAERWLWIVQKNVESSFTSYDFFQQCSQSTFCINSQKENYCLCFTSLWNWLCHLKWGKKFINIVIIHQCITQNIRAIKELNHVLTFNLCQLEIFFDRVYQSIRPTKKPSDLISLELNFTPNRDCSLMNAKLLFLKKKEIYPYMT